MLGDQVDAALDRAAPLQPGTGHGVGESQRRVILVQVARLEDQHRHRIDDGQAVRAERVEVRGRQPPALRPARPADDEVAGQDRARRARQAGGDPGRSSRVAPAGYGRPASAAESALDRTPGVDDRHRRPVGGVGVDVAVDGDAVGRVGGGRGDRRVAPIRADERRLDRLRPVGTSPTPVNATRRGVMLPPLIATTAATPTIE